jgi:hypothetical protein
MDLSKTLFQRLSFRGLQPIFLNIQYVMLTQVFSHQQFVSLKNVTVGRRYRLHPSISHVPNSVFYTLVDGVTHAERSPLTPRAAAAAFLDVRGR